MAEIDFVAAGTFRTNTSLLRPLALLHELTQLGHTGCCHFLESDATREIAIEYGVGSLVSWVPTKNPADYLKSIQARSSDSILVLGNVSLVGSVCAFERRRAHRMVISDWDELLSSKTQYSFYHRAKWRILETMARRLSHSFILASTDLKAWFDTCYPKIRNTYIPYGTTLVDPAAESTRPLDWQPAPGTRWLAYLGSISTAYRRDLEELQMLAAISRTFGLNLLVIGDGDQRPDLEKKLQREVQSGRVRFTGFIKTMAEVDRLLGRPEIAACFLPLENTIHNRARCPNKLFHYMKAQKPVITNQVGEVFRALKSVGFYYDYANPHSLDDAIQRATTSSRAYNLAEISWTNRARAFDAWLTAEADRLR